MWYVPFEGIYEGNEYYVLGLRPTSSVAGLFGVIGANGVVRDLAVVDFDYETEARYAGGLAGINYGLIENCGSGVNLTSAATIFREGQTEAVPITTLDSEIKATGVAGGLVAFNEGIIRNSRNNAEVSIIASEENTDDETYAGGIAGENTGTISNVYQNGVIEGGTYAGGIAAVNTGTIQYGYNSSKVTGTTAGAIVGISENAEIFNMFYENVTDKASGNQEDTAIGVTKMAASDMKQQAFADTLNAQIEGTGLRSWIYSASKNAGYPKFGEDVLEETIMRGASQGDFGTLIEGPDNQGGTSGGTTENAPGTNTGDHNNITLMFILLLASASCIVVCMKKRGGRIG